MSLNAIIDVDDVLATLRVPMCRALNEYTGRNLSPGDWTRYYGLQDAYGITTDEFLDTLRRERVLERSLPEPGASSALAELRAAGYRIYLVTARGWHPQGEPITRDWLTEHCIPYDHLVLVPFGEHKSNAFRPLADRFAFMVDDNDHHLDDAMASGVVGQSYVVDRPWNTYRTDLQWGVRRFESLAATVAEHLSRAREPAARRGAESAAPQSTT